MCKLFKNHEECGAEVKGYLRLKYVAECIRPRDLESYDKIGRIVNSELIAFTVNTSF